MFHSVSKFAKYLQVLYVSEITGRAFNRKRRPAVIQTSNNAFRRNIAAEILG